ncbi:MAG: DNA topoisomerase III [Candidatus Acididesulfobacter diazotrophicus]|uniref:DNA topoisomerase n=1 Tax=Candidatus Acididesulfobacter diazotrophicus TaxID=2597226 RepID=A0A519BKC6_9DELT|nr:MAG: DNA topoisomerase III [Candidatus Acididesulfobacter diazotrophicus]
MLIHKRRNKYYMKLIIAEKPSVAKAVATFLGSSVRHDGYFETKDYTITFCYGHILEQFGPKEYLGRPVNINDAPLIPEKWQLKVKESALAQFKVIKSLIAKASEIINLGDPDREGQLLVDELIEYCNYKGIVKRLWLNALDDETIGNSFKNLEDNNKYVNFKNCALARQRLDWIIGFNASIVATKKTNQLLSIGRVQTPTLSLIVERDLKIENFKPQDFYEVFVDIEHAKPFTVKWIKGDIRTDEENRITDKQAAEKLAGLVKNTTGKVINFESKKGTSKAPNPYNLAKLTKDASDKYGFSADAVLKLAQSLYEKAFTTYPRVDSEYLPEEQFENSKKILSNFDLPKTIDFTKKHPSWNTKKVDAHHAIIPTVKKAAGLGQDEQNLYNLIANRFINLFMPDQEFITKLIEIDIKNNIFSVKKKIITNPGWSNEKSQDDLPNVKINDILNTLDSRMESKQTTPPVRFTDGTLIAAMANIHKYTEDDKDIEILKEVKGIGTSATRANIIETLIMRGYIQRQKKNLVSVDLGRKLISDLQVAENIKMLTSAHLTADMEEELKLIEKGEKTIEEIMGKGVLTTKELTASLKYLPFSIKGVPYNNPNAKIIGKCGCGGNITEFSKGYKCVKCESIVWKEFSKKNYPVKLPSAC